MIKFLICVLIVAFLFYGFRYWEQKKKKNYMAKIPKGVKKNSPIDVKILYGKALQKGTCPECNHNGMIVVKEETYPGRVLACNKCKQQFWHDGDILPSAYMLT